MMTSISIVSEGTVGWTCYIKPMGDHYAVMRGEALFGIIERERYDETYWSWGPLGGDRDGYLRLDVALDKALKAARAAS